jgi:hypothetical protein
MQPCASRSPPSAGGVTWAVCVLGADRPATSGGSGDGGSVVQAVNASASANAAPSETEGMTGFMTGCSMG